MPTAALKTLGCKLNQYETEQMREQLQRLGYAIVDFDSPADLYIINSCTVTHHADRDTRRLARRAKRAHPHAHVIVTGCYAEVAAQELQALPEISLVCGMADKQRLGELVRGLSPTTRAPGREGADPGEHGSHLITGFAEHTRCFVKVQEGCNARCSYCIVPDARGPSRSVPPDEVVEQTRRLALAGHPEIVLIGTHLGQFGRDLPEPTDLTALVRCLLALPELQRLRLSSIEPCEVSTELVGLMAEGKMTREPELCRYLHIPLQSGCDSVLRRMNRPYDAALYAELVRRIHGAQPAAGLGADVIVGFPGETDEEFEQTRQFVSDLPLSYLHVFTYSPRRGTPAAAMPDQVPHEVALARNHVLRAMSERKRAAFAESMVGQTLGVVLQTDEGEGWLRGVTDNYLELRVQGATELLHTLVTCAVTGADAGALTGRLL
ncbi:tRNA (N(6)-L-threonylcarbamoyladenosine(37)-C(2))-methylthiotransferase MtaB [bacterium]|nr:tRNA (N(6)-L-threonylcarbamoyladenosine(37)-C(2))-methylthiotransferase MtaB [bacterium]